MKASELAKKLNIVNATILFDRISIENKNRYGINDTQRFIANGISIKENKSGYTEVRILTTTESIYKWDSLESKNKKIILKQLGI